MEVAQPQRDQSTPFVGRRQPDQHGSSDDTDAVCRYHDYAARIWEARADEAATEQSGELNKAARDLEILGAEGVEAKGRDDDGSKLCWRLVSASTLRPVFEDGSQGTYTRQSGIGHLRTHGHHEQNPRLGIL